MNIQKSSYLTVDQLCYIKILLFILSIYSTLEIMKYNNDIESQVSLVNVFYSYPREKYDFETPATSNNNDLHDG